jgi:hypothetical protein
MHASHVALQRDPVLMAIEAARMSEHAHDAVPGGQSGSGVRLDFLCVHGKRFRKQYRAHTDSELCEVSKIVS